MLEQYSGFAELEWPILYSSKNPHVLWKAKIGQRRRWTSRGSSWFHSFYWSVNLQRYIFPAISFDHRAAPLYLSLPLNIAEHLSFIVLIGRRETEKKWKRNLVWGGGAKEAGGQQRIGNAAVCCAGGTGSSLMEMGVRDEQERREEERRRGFNELMTVLTTRCLLSPAQTQPMK